MSSSQPYFVEPLERNFASIRAEMARLAADDFMPWPERDAYMGQWLLFPFVAGVHDHWGVEVDDWSVDLDSNRARCPETFRVLGELDGLVTAGFSRLEPGTHIYPHADAADTGHLRCHLALDIPEGAKFRIGGELGGWTEGRCRVFSGSELHEAANLGQRARTVLLCDFVVEPGG